MKKEQGILQKSLWIAFSILVYTFFFASIAYTGLYLTHMIWSQMPSNMALQKLKNAPTKYTLRTKAGEVTKRLVTPVINRAIRTVLHNPHRIFPFAGSVMVTVLPFLRPVGNICNAAGRVLRMVPPDNSQDNRPIELAEQAERMTTSVTTLEDLQSPSEGTTQNEWTYTGANNLLETLVLKTKPYQFDMQNLFLFLIIFIIITIVLSIILVKITRKTTDYILSMRHAKALKTTSTRPSKIIPKITKPTFSSLKKSKNKVK